MSRLTTPVAGLFRNPERRAGGAGGNGPGRAAKVARCRQVVEDYLRAQGLAWDAACMDRVEAFAQGNEAQRAAVGTCLEHLRILLGPHRDTLPEDVRKCLKRLRRLAKQA